MVESVYHPDAIDNHGSWKGRGADFAREVVAQFDRSRNIGQHHITNIVIERDGDRARVESYFIAFNPDAPDGPDAVALVGGRYLDLFERRVGRWLIARRDVVLDVTRESIPGRPWPGHRYFHAGARGTGDPSRNFFAQSTIET